MFCIFLIKWNNSVKRQRLLFFLSEQWTVNSGLKPWVPWLLLQSVMCDAWWQLGWLEKDENVYVTIILTSTKPVLSLLARTGQVIAQPDNDLQSDHFCCFIKPRLHWAANLFLVLVKKQESVWFWNKSLCSNENNATIKAVKCQARAHNCYCFNFPDALIDDDPRISSEVTNISVSVYCLVAVPDISFGDQVIGWKYQLNTNQFSAQKCHIFTTLKYLH